MTQLTPPPPGFHLVSRIVEDGSGSGGVRLDKWLGSCFPELTRTSIQEALQAGRVRINGKAIGKKGQAHPGDSVHIEIPVLPGEAPPMPVAIPLDILYEDAHLIVINKAPGMVTHPGNGTGANTLVHALLAHCGPENLSRANATDRPGIVHRLDKDTSGVILCAKTDAAYHRLQSDFASRQIHKVYLAIVQGVPCLKSGSIRSPIGRHPTHRTRMAVVTNGKEAHTDWVLLHGASHFSLLRCVIHTGRTHQIRVHLSSITHPILGDRLYGFQPNKLGAALPPQRPLLHAHELSIRHPVSGSLITFRAPVPEDFLQWIPSASINSLTEPSLHT